jgi:zinc transport system ATP-binding protein
MTQIEIEDLSFSYDVVQVLRNVYLRVRQGEFIGVMGPNGGGKTTLLKLVLGFLQPERGKIIVRGKIGYVPQALKSDRDFPITLHELVLLGALSKTNALGMYPAEVKERALALIDQLGLTAHKNKVFGSLSGGLAQRALLARALVADPDLLLLDEPTAHVDPTSASLIYQWLELLKGKKTILLVTHDLKTVIERVDRVLCVQNSVSSFLPKEVCEHFAMGLYHTPLLSTPANPFIREEHVLPVR